MPRVLVAATPDVVAELERSILKRSGVEYMISPDPAQAFDAIRTSRPDLVLLGEIPGTDSGALLRRVRSNPGTRKVQIAVINLLPPSLAEEADLRRAGANVVLSADMIPGMSEDSIDRLLDVPLRREADMAVHFVIWSHVGPDNPPMEGRSVNVSVRGLLLRTPEPVDIGSKLELTFRLPGDDVEIRAVGKAVREHPRGDGLQIGVEFLILRDIARDRIRKYVAAPPAP